MSTITPGTADQATINTPVGPFTVIVTHDEVGPLVLASGWTDQSAALLPQIHSSLRPATLHSVSTIAGITEAVTDFHDGDLASIEPVRVLQRSAEYREHAWQVLRTAAPGAPWSYSDFAVATGRPAAIRAAAGACAANAAALFVPCHRVVRSDGSLGGFRWGLAVKSWLLNHESGS